MDANGRDSLALERGENGMFVKAAIFDHLVSFTIDEVTSVDTPMEALSDSLNKYGEVNLEYMKGLVDMGEEKLVEGLGDHIYYNPHSISFTIHSDKKRPQIARIFLFWCEQIRVICEIRGHVCD